MQPAGNYHEGHERVRQLSALFLRRLHEIASEVYAEVLSSGVIRPEEMEEEIQRYFAKKKSGLQDVYSYYGEQWDYYYQVVVASDADFLPMLQQARSVFARLYVPAELDVLYYMEQLVRYPRTDSRWLTLRQHFMKKWRNLLEGRERTYQKQHITQSPELRVKLKQLSQIIRKSQLIKELNHVLGRKKADEQRLYQAMIGRTPVTLLRSATHSDIVGITEGNNLNALLPMEYCFLSDAALEPVFYRRYTEKKLAVFDAMSRQMEYAEASSHSGRDLQKRAKHGPFVVCVDTSASMKGERELLSKAVVLSLALIADKLRRPCRVILFSDQTEAIELNNLYSDLALLETFLCNSFHGGSDMTCAMKESVEVLMREDFYYADLLWLSDFEMDPLTPVWVQYVEELKQRGMRLYAVSFGHRSEASYLRLADRIWAAD